MSSYGFDFVGIESLLYVFFYSMKNELICNLACCFNRRQKIGMRNVASVL